MLLLICLGLSLAACALPFLTGTVYFMVADDYLLNYIANGSYGLTNSDHLIFIRIPVGALLKALYSVTASVNWYMILLLAGTVLSFALLHTCVWKRTGSYPAMLLSLIINYITVAYFFSFTVVAFLCCPAPAFPDRVRRTVLSFSAGLFSAGCPRMLRFGWKQSIRRIVR